MKVILVSRHKAVLEWIQTKGIDVDEHLEHLQIEQVKPGDTVIGNLPIGIVAKLNKDHINYIHINLTIPFEYRGTELSLEQMEQFNAELEAFKVVKTHVELT